MTEGRPRQTHCKRGHLYSEHGYTDTTNRQICRACRRTWRADRKEELRKRRTANNRLHKFGVSPTDYQNMLMQQGGVCAICRGPSDLRSGEFAVDHNHQTGQVRGLLCVTCNVALGRLEGHITAVVAYLQKLH